MSARPSSGPTSSLVEQTYRGEQSYIVKDPKSRKYFRFRPVEVDGHAAVRRRADRSRGGGGAGRRTGISVSAGGGREIRREAQGDGPAASAPSASARCCMMERLRAAAPPAARAAALFQGDIFRIRWSMGDPDEFMDRTHALPPLHVHPRLPDRVGRRCSRSTSSSSRSSGRDFTGAHRRSLHLQLLGLGALSSSGSPAP